MAANLQCCFKNRQMLYYYFKIALRNFRTNRIYLLLNVFGLGLSIACCMLIFILVNHHRSFDAYHTKVDRIARFITELHLDPIMKLGAVPNPFATALRTEFSCLDKAAMRSSYNNVLITVPNLTSWNGVRGSVGCYALVKEGHQISELAVESPAF
jgi:hypothetical protein